MFPWQGEGKGDAFSVGAQQREHRHQQLLQQQQSSARQDNGYTRWRVSSVLQQQDSGQDVNDDRPSNNHASSSSSSDAANRRTSPLVEESHARPESTITSVSGVDEADEEGEDDDEDGAEEQGESEGEDIGFRSSPRNGTAPATTSTVTSTNGSEKQIQHLPFTKTPPTKTADGRRPGERMPPLGYPAQPHFRNIHARRLNAEEEIKLFELCVKHSSTFGERSKLCEWWKNIANEFIEKYGGPYSWHSVRRKVDLVTKQRIKYLADLKEGKIETDQATEPWKKVLDEWIPVWQKFEDSEKRRIEVRDQRAAMRKRKEPSNSGDVPTAEGSNPSSPAPSSSAPAAKRKSIARAATTTTASTAPGSWQPTTPSRWPPPGPNPYYGPAPYPMPPGPTMGPPAPSTPGMKLPDGYDTMFRSPAHPAAAHHPMYAYPPPHQPYYTPPMASTPGGPAPPTMDSTLTSAVIETLTKLNKHLEKADAGSSSLVTALTGTATTTNTTSNDTNDKPTTTTENGTTSPPTSPSEASHQQSTTVKLPNTNTLETETETASIVSSTALQKLKQEICAEFETEIAKIREAFTSKLDALEQTQEMIMEMLRQEPGREGST